MRYSWLLVLFLIVPFASFPLYASGAVESQQKQFMPSQVTLLHNGSWYSSLYGGSDLAISPDGAVYTTGSLGDAPAGTAQLELLKWTPEAALVWNRTWDGAWNGLEVDISPDGHIYTLGQRYNGTHVGMVLAKWDPDSSLLWNRTWYGPAYEAKAYCLACDSEGNVYTGGLARWRIASEILGYPVYVSFWLACLAKWSQQGDLVWSWNETLPLEGPISIYVMPGLPPNTTLELFQGSPMTSIATASDGSIYGYYYGNLTKWDCQGDLTWTESIPLEYYHDLKTDSEGMICAAGILSPFNEMLVKKWFPNGTEAWQSVYPENCTIYTKGYWEGQAIATSDDFVYTGGRDKRYDGILIKWDHDGNRVWNMTWNGPEFIGGIELGHNNLIYVSTWRSLLVFSEGATLSTPGDFTVYLIVVAGALSVVVVILVIRYRRAPV